MTQFAAYKNQNPDTRETYPYFVDVQHNLLDPLNSRIVIPLASNKNLNDLNISNLCPKVTIDNEVFVLLTQQMTSVPLSALKKPVTSLEHIRDDIIAAIDFLITGI